MRSHGAPFLLVPMATGISSPDEFADEDRPGRCHVWDNPLLAALGLMVFLSVLFYKVNLHFLAGGQLAVMIWMVVGVPLFAISFALMAALLHPPQSYGALAALASIGNGMLGLGLRLLTMRRRRGPKR